MEKENGQGKINRTKRRQKENEKKTWQKDQNRLMWISKNTGTIRKNKINFKAVTNCYRWGMRKAQNQLLFANMYEVHLVWSRMREEKPWTRDKNVEPEINNV